MSTVRAPGWRQVLESLESMGNTVVQLGLVRVLHITGRNTSNEDLLRAPLMTGKVALWGEITVLENIKCCREKQSPL